MKLPTLGGASVGATQSDDGIDTIRGSERYRRIMGLLDDAGVPVEMRDQAAILLFHHGNGVAEARQWADAMSFDEYFARYGAPFGRTFGFAEDLERFVGPHTASSLLHFVGGDKLYRIAKSLKAPSTPSGP
jgi:hypothetical protein